MKSLLIGVVAATGLLSCACTGSGGGAPGAARPAATVTITASPGSSAPATSGSAADARPVADPASGQSATDGSAGAPGASGTGTGAAQAAPGCLGRYLNVTAVPSGDSGDSLFVNLDFKNLDNHPCTLYGYPGVSFSGGRPVTQIGLASRENLASPRQLVTLQPGGTAWTQLQIVSAVGLPPSACRPRHARFLDVIAPNNVSALPVFYSATACAGPVPQLTVDAVRPGANP